MAEANVTLTQQQFEALLSRISNLSTQSLETGNFSSCSSRFNGSKDSDVNAFIDAIETFKDCSKVSDANALRGLSMLLDDFAATWWYGVKDTVATWETALDLLRLTFGPRKPAYLVYREIFSKEQDIRTPSDVFICQSRSLLAQLPANTLTESTQIDMIYGLLHKRIREKVPRDKIRTFNELLKECRMVEETFVDHFDRPSNDKRPKCRFCKYLGHTEDQCRKKQGTASTSTKTSTTAPSPSNPVTSVPNSTLESHPPRISNQVTCYGCNRPGYIKSNCPTCSNTAASVEFCALDNVEVPVYPQSRPILPINILGMNGQGLIDTAAKHSVASGSLYEALRKHNVPYTKTRSTIKLADGTVKEQEVKLLRVDVLLGSRYIPTTFMTLPNADKTLLGIDFLRSANLVLDIGQQNWSFADDILTKYPLVYEDDHKISNIEVLSVSILRSDEAIMLSSEEHKQLSDLLEANQDIFALGGEPTPYAEHYIDTKSHAPISVPPYRMTPGNKEKLRQELDKMLRDDIIEECESAWSAPVVLVPKKNGETRVCCDYRALNAITTPVHYPLPRMDDLLHATKKTIYMSAIDLRAGYHQVKVREADRDKTSFVTPFGTFRYLVMPFGLRNAPATFQKLIDRFRSGLPSILILAYLDDVLVISETFDQHMTDLKRVFERLRTYKLRANRDKCTFATPQVKYLGHLITSNGIQVDPEKTSAITKMHPPQNVKQVRSFLQSASWYRRFIDRFAELSRPLSNLLKKDATWNWGPDQKNSFESLLRALASAPVLQQNDPSKPYVLRTDASSYALGVVLVQGEGSEEHPVEYASRLQTTGFSAAYLNFAREMRNPDEVQNDPRPVRENENFIPEITPYLQGMFTTIIEAKGQHEKCQDRQKKYADNSRSTPPTFDVGDKVFVTLHTKSSHTKQSTTKFDPKRDGPYVITRQVSPVSYEIANIDTPGQPLGIYHCSNIFKYRGDDATEPKVPIRRRGRPKKTNHTSAGPSTSQCPRNQRGRL